MKRRQFITHAAAATLIAGTARLLGQTSAASRPAPPPPPPAPPAPLASIAPPVLQNVTETSASVFWAVSGTATGWIEYGETEALGLTADGECGGLRPFDPRVLRVRLENLRPGTQYFYRVHTAPLNFYTPYRMHRGEVVVGPVYAFRTLDSSATQARFMVWNDTHQRRDTLKTLVERLPEYPTDFLLWNGDIFNTVASEEMLVAETLHPAGLEYAATRPLVFARGNHDVRGPAARMLGRALEAPAGRYYHSFRHGPVAFLVLDTGEDKRDSHPEYGGLADFAAYRSQQVPWLERALNEPAFKSAPFRVLITHIPLRGPEESVDSRQKWEPLLRGARIDFAISGHTHRHAYHEPTDAQPWPLVVGGGPDVPQATYIHVEASSSSLSVRMFGLDRRNLGSWTVPARA